MHEEAVALVREALFLLEVSRRERQRSGIKLHVMELAGKASNRLQDARVLFVQDADLGSARRVDAFLEELQKAAAEWVSEISTDFDIPTSVLVDFDRSLLGLSRWPE